MNNIKVSVIVPVYNVEPYLRRCLDSLVYQTLKDIEIICINDCSPDKSLAILKKYAQKDNRVKIIDFKKNQGVSAARNAGIKIAKGEYIGFCDPDDYVDLDFFGKLYELAKNKNADIAKGNIKILNWNTKIETIDNNCQIQASKYFFKTCFSSGIYKKLMLEKHSVKFPVANVINCGDTVFLSHAVIIAKKVFFLNGSYYHYIKRASGSLDSAIFDKEKLRSTLHCVALILDRLNSSKISKNHYCYEYRSKFFYFISLLYRISDTKAIKEIATSIMKFYKKCKFPKKLNLSDSIVSAIERKDEQKLISLLQEWKEIDFYPQITISKSILQNRNLYVWGTGNDGIRVKKQCESNGWKITGFLDSNKNIKKHNEYKVERPERILNKPKGNFFIIISSRKYSREIAGICRKAGLKKETDYWTTGHDEL